MSGERIDFWAGRPCLLIWDADRFASVPLAWGFAVARAAVPEWLALTYEEQTARLFPRGFDKKPRSRKWARA